MKQNPWLRIPAKDYDAHMSSSEVDQFRFLSDVFETSLQKYRPRKIAVLGCATGNGLEKIDWDTVDMVTAFDINDDYLKSIEKKFSRHGPKLQIVCADLEDHDLGQYAFDLVYAGLIFEYLDANKLLKNIRHSLSKDGKLIAVLQLADSKHSKVSKTPYKSLESLNTIMNLQEPGSFKANAEQLGYDFLSEKVSVLKSGKKFWIGHFGSI